jgi:general secretion pathway protein K
MSTGNRRGSALLAVLWLSMALAAIALTLSTTVRGEAERASTAADGVRSYYLATAAIQRAILHMIWGGRFWAPGTPAFSYSFPSGDAFVEIIPEAAKLNVNSTRPEDLFRLLQALGVSGDQARTVALAIADWRSPVIGGQATPFDLYYLSRTPSFRSPHASFEEIEELLLIQGMTPDIFYGTYDTVARPDGGARLVARGGLSDCLSVFGSDTVDVNSASPAVLATLGVPPDVAGFIVERRRNIPFRAQDLGPLAQAAGPGAGHLRIGGNTIYTLRATARLRLPNGQFSDLKRTVAAMVKLMPPGYDAPYHVLRWYDNAWSH